MQIRKAMPCDIEEIMRVYEAARKFMRESGNLNQWTNGYPQKEILILDIEKENLYVCENDNKINAVFFMGAGPDQTYLEIEQGRWLNDLPYGVIHRIASDGTKHGVLAFCVEFCKTFFGEIRIDTHSDNLVMQHLLRKNGFKRCGIIHLANGDPRIAFQYTSQGEKI